MKETILFPLEGDVKSITETPDQVFSMKLLGDGFMTMPKSGKVIAPFDGEIKTVAATKHAIGLTSTGGLDLLIHIGLETVALKGEGFDVKVAEGDSVKQGDVIMEFDLDFITQKADSIASPVIILEKTSVELIETKTDEKGTLVTFEAN